ncbi:MAG: hemolysin III family protein [Acidimicrobiales bacterium]
MGDQRDASPRPTSRRLRPTGSAESPRGRGLIHLGALVLALPAGVLLVCRYGVGEGVGVYALTLVGLYAASVSYRLGRWSPIAFRRARQVDYAMIYVFIAGCMTPYCLLAVPGAVSRVVLAIGWFWVAAAVLTIAIWFEATRRFMSWAYLLLGWLPVVTLPEAIHDLTTLQFILVGAMGLLYTAGVGVLAARWPDPRPEVFGYHEVWHTMVVVASACYFVVVWSLAAPHY